MNKKTFFAAILLAAASPVLAQSEQSSSNGDIKETVEYNSSKYQVETNNFWDNWFITAGAGPQIFFGDHDRQIGVGKRISPALQVAIGKWFTPEMGVRITYSGLSAKGATRWGAAHSTGEQVSGWGSGLYYSKFKFFNVHADALFNFSNIFCGYNAKRIWNSTPYVGVGWMRTWESPTAGNITMNVGWINSFRLCDALDFNIDIHAALVDDAIDGETGQAKFDGMLNATVGLTYKFKERGWDRSKSTTIVRYDQSEIDAMRDKLNAMSAENAKLKKALADGNEKQARELVNKIAAANFVVFEIGKSDLSNEARVNLGLLARVIKSIDNKTVYTITGYADAGTGSEKLNERLSKARAEAVYECLVNEFKVPASQLQIDYKGGVENMFYDDPRMSRAVIMQSK